MRQNMKNKKIFSCNSDIKKNAYISWCMKKNDSIHNMECFANAYAKATKELLEIVLSDNSDKKADTLIFCILYTFNHCIELYEKSILLQVHSLLNKPYEIEISHDIKKIYNNMIATVIERENGKELQQELEKHFRDLTNYIDELYPLIEDGNKLLIDFSRYPIKSNGDPQFYVTDAVIIIDLENLKVRVENIINLLNSLLQKYRAEYEEEYNYSSFDF